MAHTYDTKNEWQNQSGNPINLSLTLGSTATILVVSLKTEQVAGGPRTGGAPTYNSATLTQVGSVNGGSDELDLELWYLLDPDTGSSYTLSIPNTGTETVHVVASSYISATGTSQYDTGDSTATGNSASASDNLTPSADGAVIVSNCASDHRDPMTGNQTSLYMSDYGSMNGGDMYHLQATAAQSTHTYTLGGSDKWGVCIVAFIESAADITASVSDSITIADVVTVDISAGNLTVDDSESITVSDVVVAVISFPALSVSDSITVADAVTVSLSGSSVNESETITIADAVTAVVSGLVASESESITIVDDVTVSISGGNLTASVSDSITVADSVTVSLSGPSVSVSDSITVADAVTATVSGLIISESESISISDVVTAVVSGLVISEAESITVSDVVAASISGGQLSVDESESITISDVVTVESASEVTASESIAVTDVVTINLGAGNLTVDISDAVSITDVASLEMDMEWTASEILTFNDVVTATLGTGGISSDISDSISITDSVYALIPNAVDSEIFRRLNKMQSDLNLLKVKALTS